MPHPLDDDPPADDLACPKCGAVGTVVVRAVVWLSVRYFHGHCHGCGYVWVEPASPAGA